MFDSVIVQPEGLGTPVGEVLSILAEHAAPGPNAVAMLACLDPTALTGAEQVDLIRGLERQLAWLTACQVQAIAALDRSGDDDDHPNQGCGPDGVEWVSLDLAAALRLSAGTAQRRLQVARQLTDRLPGTCAALAGGTIGYWHATAIVEVTESLPADSAARVEERVLRRAGGQSVAELRRSLRRAVIVADPPAAQAAHDDAAAGRRVDRWGLPDGMAELRLIATAPDVAAVYTALTALADQPTAPGDTRGIDARRADALVATFTALLAGGGLPARQGQHPHINVTVAATTLLGDDDEPGDLAGYGPITAETARRVAADGTWRRILYDPADGHLLEYGRTTYTPPATLQRHIIARDRVCTFPHCNQPAARCDIDHAIPWGTGGTTDPINCGALCRRHHRGKTHAGWHLKRQPDHTATWTSPTGHTYHVPPPSYHDDTYHDDS